MLLLTIMIELCLNKAIVWACGNMRGPRPPGSTGGGGGLKPPPPRPPISLPLHNSVLCHLVRFYATSHILHYGVNLIVGQYNPTN